MRDVPNRRTRLWPRSFVVGLLASFGLALAWPALASAGKLSWLDDVVREVVRETEAGGKAAVRVGGDGANSAVRGSTRWFAREADEGLEILAKRSDDLARAGRKGAEVGSDALLRKRFARLIPRDPDSIRTFAALAPAEKRLVVEMGETAQRLARRYPGQAEGMIRALGTEGLSAVRVFGDDVAEVIVKEGPGAVGVLRKTGRGGLSFFKASVLPHKKKLIAAGVFAAFLADPDKFVDYVGRATEYAVREFARAGVSLAGAVTNGAAKGLEATIARLLEAYGLNFAIARYAGMALAACVALVAGMVLLGMPVRWMLRPITWSLGLVLGRRRRPLEA